MPGAGRAPDAGNRMEIRVRGNAHQLLEKYKTLARDAAQQGDRVTAEYYLQYADHYYRVLNDGRPRHDEQRYRPRDDHDDAMADDGAEGFSPETAMTREPPRPPAAIEAADEAPPRAAESDAAADGDDDGGARRRRGRGRGRPRRDADGDAAPELAIADI